MNDTLKEMQSHGTPQYPFVLYKTDSPETKIFVSLHWHDEVEIIYIVEGTLFLTIDNAHYTGTSGQIFFINKRELHEMHVSDTSCKYYAFLFSLDSLSFQTIDYVEATYFAPLKDCRIKFANQLSPQNNISDTIEELLLHIIHINEEHSNAYQLGTKSSLLQIIYLLLANETKEYSLSNLQASEFKKDIISYINANYTSKIQLKDISYQFHMSPKYFSRVFKKHFYKTFVEYLNYVRIEHAMALLNSSDISVTEVALSVGIENTSYFIRTFKQLVNCTPYQYRKKLSDLN